MTNERTLHRIKISICVSFSEFYFAKKNLHRPPSPPKKEKKKRKKNMQNSFVHTSNMLYSTSKNLPKRKENHPKQESLGWKVHIAKTRLVTQTLSIQVIVLQKESVCEYIRLMPTIRRQDKVYSSCEPVKTVCCHGKALVLTWTPHSLNLNTVQAHPVHHSRN